MQSVHSVTDPVSQFRTERKKKKNLYFLTELEPRNAGLLVVETSCHNKAALNKAVNLMILAPKLKVLFFKATIASNDVALSDNVYGHGTHNNY